MSELMMLTTSRDPLAVHASMPKMSETPTVCTMVGRTLLAKRARRNKERTSYRPRLPNE
jgi:hypothetical protein